MPTSTLGVRQRRRAAGAGRTRSATFAGAARLVSHPPADPSRRARVRLGMLEWHAAHGRDVSRTVRHFGFSRPTVYRWLARYDRSRLASLEDRSCRPHRRRRPTWTLDQLRAVRDLRERYPRWGQG